MMLYVNSKKLALIIHLVDFEIVKRSVHTSNIQLIQKLLFCLLHRFVKYFLIFKKV